MNFMYTEVVTTVAILSTIIWNLFEYTCVSLPKIYPLMIMYLSGNPDNK